MVLLLAAGCRGNKIVVNGIEIYERYWNQAVQELSSRTHFDLGCPAHLVTFTLLKRSGRAASEVGVSGCGHRGTYVRSIGYGVVGPWVLNVYGQTNPAGGLPATTPTSPPPTMPPPPPPAMPPPPPPPPPSR